MQTVEDIEAEIAELEDKRQAEMQRQRLAIADNVAEVVGRVSAADLVDIFQHAALKLDADIHIEVVKPARPKLPAKYRNPENYAQTWSGRGKAPAWFDKARESEFLIRDGVCHV